MSMRDCPTIHLDKAKVEEHETVQQYTQTQIKVEEHETVQQYTLN